jgi:hypothetical protein
LNSEIGTDRRAYFVRGRIRRKHQQSPLYSTQRIYVEKNMLFIIKTNYIFLWRGRRLNRVRCRRKEERDTEEEWRRELLVLLTQTFAIKKEDIF